MKFKDLPIGTKFLDDTEINWGEPEEMIKVSDTLYDYPSCLLDANPCEFDSDCDVYPILEFLDD